MIPTMNMAITALDGSFAALDAGGAWDEIEFKVSAHMRMGR